MKSASDFKNLKIDFTSNLEIQVTALFIVTVPTPIDSTNNPNLNPLVSVKQSGQYFKKMSYLNQLYIQDVLKRFVCQY